ncbi:MAG: ATP-binding protein [Candidatus Thermoplasmatota archaeon]
MNELIVRKFTIKDKLLIHLLDCGFPKEDLHGEIDISFSQEGISLAISAARSLVSRAVEELVQQGLLTVTSSRVRAKRAKVRVYQLTGVGLEKAEQLKKEAESLTLSIKDFNNKLKVLKVGYLIKEFPTLSIVKILDLIPEEGYLSLENLKALATKAQYVDFSFQAPKLRYFFDREKELELLRSWIDDSETKIIAIKGIAGIGKSALGVQIVSSIKNERNVFWYTIQEWSSQLDILRAVSQFMYSMGKPQLNNYLSSTKNPAFEEISKLIQAGIDNTNTLLAFDDVQKAQGDVIIFLKSLFTLLRSVQKVKLLVIGRLLKELYSVREVAVERAVKELTLEGLNEKGGIAILKARGFIKELKKLYLLTAGHPLCLELIDYKGMSERNIARYIREEIFSKLSEQERKALSLSSVFRKPFFAEAFYVDNLAETATIETLVEKSMLYLHEDNTYSAHDLIKSFFYRRLTSQELVFYHRTAAKYYIAVEDYLEALSHYLQAKDRAQVLELLVTKGEELLELGYTEELLKLTEEIKNEDLNFEERVKLAQIEKILARA